MNQTPNGISAHAFYLRPVVRVAGIDPDMTDREPDRNHSQCKSGQDSQDRPADRQRRSGYQQVDEAGVKLIKSGQEKGLNL